MNKNIFIYGPGKSGTTACFYHWKKKMGGNKVIELYEPKTLSHIMMAVEQGRKAGRPVVCKQLTEFITDDQLFLIQQSLQPCKTFSVKRGIEDTLISWLLFMPKHFLILPDQQKKYLEILKKKQEYPGSISVTEICEFLFHLSNYTVKPLESLLNSQMKAFEIDDKLGEDKTKVSYEHILKLTKNTFPQGRRNIVARTRKTKNWKNWYHKEKDQSLLTFFKSLDNIICESTSHDLSLATQKIEYDESVGYMRKVFESHRNKSSTGNGK